MRALDPSRLFSTSGAPAHFTRRDVSPTKRALNLRIARNANVAGEIKITVNNIVNLYDARSHLATLDL